MPPSTVLKPTDPWPLVPLGRTGMAITRVGLGAWAIGGPDWLVGWGPQDDEASVAAIRHAARRGINWIDTAAIYGVGHSEEVVGAALAGLAPAERPYVFTKCGQVWDPDDRYTKQRVGRPDSIRAECEGSLRRLGVEVIDLYQMHWPAEDGTALDDYWSTLLDLKAQGKVRAVGLSNHNLEHLEAAERLGHVDTLQPPLSAVRRDAAQTLLPWCRAHDTGVIVYSPMQSGVLSGRFSAERAAALPASDWRSRHPDYSGPALTRNLAVAKAFEPIAAKHGVSVAAVAIAWTLAWPAVSGAIVGARSPDQVDGWIDAAALMLDDQDLDLIAAAIEAAGAGSGAARPQF